MNYTTLISTVGTSLFFPNLVRLDPQRYLQSGAANDKLIAEDIRSLEKKNLAPGSPALQKILECIKQHYDAQSWSHLAKALVQLPPSLRLCGAEINSIFAMYTKKYLPEKMEQMIFLISDTLQGEQIGKILKAYFSDRKAFIRTKDVHVITIEGLQDEDPVRFQREGLVNLVRVLGEKLQQYGGEKIAINATGGYKAQIALAVAFGQVAKTSVYYKHERFNQVIPFPRVPFTMDFSVVRENLKLWDFLAEPGRTASFEEISNRGTIDERLKPLLDHIEVDGEELYAISAFGMVYWEGFRAQYPEIVIIPPNASQDERKGCHIHHHKYPKKFPEYIQQVYAQHPFIKECHTIDYHGQEGLQKNSFHWSGRELIGHYCDRGFGGRFKIITTANTPLQRQGAFKQLNEWLNK